MRKNGIYVGLVGMMALGGMMATDACGQATAGGQAIEQERHFFDFLLGEWEIADESETAGDDVYTFRPTLDGAGILSEWYFNRGSASEPNYTRGLYVSAFDEMTGTWSFYYVSPLNAMFYDGRKVDGNWYFFHTFTIDGETFLQRQSWTPKDASTVVRLIENSRDGGKTWGERYERTLRKKR